MKFRTSEYFVREVFVSLKRNNWMSFASIGTVAVSLFVLGVFLLLVLNMNRMASTLESQVQISVYLQDELKGAEKDELEERISDLSGIQSVKYVDRDEAIERFRERLGDQKYLLDALGDKNPLPDSFEVTVMQPSMVQTAAETIAQFDGVAEAKYGQDVVEHLFDITRLMRVFGLLLMVLLAGATIFIISNTIRLTVFARRKEIAIMKYVGATDWFIRWPFLLEGVVLGCIGGLVAAFALRSFYAAMAAKGELPAVVIDCGTAITFEVVNSAGEFSGGAILAGRGLLREALRHGTARLPMVERGMEKFIGKSTAEAIAAGVDGGSVGAVKAVLAGILRELGSRARIVLTGGDAEFFRPHLPEAEWVENFTLMGVFECCKNNMGKVLCE